jgi:phosphopantetheinyl transferase
MQNRIPGQAGSLKRMVQRLAPGFSSRREELVLITSMPAPVPPAGEGRPGHRHGQAAKESLARFLAEHLLGRQLPEMALIQDSLGKPRIRLGGAPGPALSFSWSAGRLWAALGRSEKGLGLDAAAPAEFSGAYPFHRIFTDAEWQEALTLTAGNRAEAGALLWSIKEAAVKAWGCGFHFLSPRQVELHGAGRDEAGYAWRVGLKNADRAGTLPGGLNPCAAISVRQPDGWLAVAWGC